MSTTSEVTEVFHKTSDTWQALKQLAEGEISCGKALEAIQRDATTMVAYYRKLATPKTLDELEAVNLRSIVQDQEADIAAKDREIAELTADHERLAADNSSMEKEIQRLRHEIADLLEIDNANRAYMDRVKVTAERDEALRNLAESRANTLAIVESIPGAVRVCEGGAHENLDASLAVSIAALRQQLAEAREAFLHVKKANGSGAGMCLTGTLLEGWAREVLAATEPKPMSDTELLNICESRRWQIVRSGYRGRDGWEIIVAWPGGHYQEERTKTIGYGQTIREALTEALKKP